MYRIAGIDVHKRMLAVVVADVAVEGDYRFERRKVGTSPSELSRLAEWLVAEQVEEVVMESTAQYWRPVWATLERMWRPKRLEEGGTGKLHLAQAQSNRGASGRKKDFPDAERLVKRLVAQELKLSFVPDVEQRLWADDNETQAPVDAESSAISEPFGVFVGGGAHQAVELGFRPAR